MAVNDLLQPVKGIYSVADENNHTLTKGTLALPANSDAIRIDEGHLATIQKNQLLLLNWTIDNKTPQDFYVLGKAPYDLNLCRKWHSIICKTQHTPHK